MKLTVYKKRFALLRKVRLKIVKRVSSGSILTTASTLIDAKGQLLLIGPERGTSFLLDPLSCLMAFDSTEP